MRGWQQDIRSRPNPKQHEQVSRVRNSMAIAGGACRARSRSEEELMLIHHDDERRRDCPATPTGPEGCGGTARSSLSLLLAMNEHWLVVAPRIWASLRSQR